MSGSDFESVSENGGELQHPVIPSVASLVFASVLNNTTRKVLAMAADETLSNSSNSYLSSWNDTTTTVYDNYSDVLYDVGTEDVFGTVHSICRSFLPANHFYFQMANSFLFLSYLAPNGIYGILYLRITLAIGSFLFALWGYVVLCALDTFIWNVIFLVINLIHACVIVYHLRPIKFPRDLENLYVQLFLPLRVSRFQFRRILNCMKEIRSLEPREPFAYEKKTKVDKLSLVLSGRFLVSQDGKPLNFVTVNQFLDSPEWFGMSTDEYFQVSVMAVEESAVLVWNRDKLKLTINGDSFLQAVFDHILGKDVVNKLMQVNEQCMSNGTVPNMDTMCSEKPQYIVHTSEDPDAILGTVTRHIQGASILAWRLGKISEETDYETSV